CARIQGGSYYYGGGYFEFW
nr:immunoglobulin heavy chain junction region [Macaca mulatta]MOX61136.1 immunoglobulin heavy chain junction region [Macaca mulatta]MOX61499.1 immunoglobulin heavy chain junction region [Macaca mulatta]MOX62280.1 immunoglobulin heavy chain junction region [Macaca mulatta]MOX62444.1 immunoglobulin heavy chain junction region [Macaca mulatta]